MPLGGRRGRRLLAGPLAVGMGREPGLTENCPTEVDTVSGPSGVEGDALLAPSPSGRCKPGVTENSPHPGVATGRAAHDAAPNQAEGRPGPQGARANRVNQHDQSRHTAGRLQPGRRENSRGRPWTRVANNPFIGGGEGGSRVSWTRVTHAKEAGRLGQGGPGLRLGQE